MRVWLKGLEGEAIEVLEGHAVSFGREGDVVVDPGNRFLHRRLGLVTFADGRWRLANLGSRIVLHVHKPAARGAVGVEPEAETSLPNGTSTVSFAAGRATYALCIDVAGGAEAPEPDGRDGEGVGLETSMPGEGVALTPSQHQVLVVMCEPKLRALGRADWTVPGNDELGRRLFISPKTVEKHVAEVCRRFADDGVQGLHAQGGQPVAERRRILVEAAVAARVVTHADLDGRDG